jgi:hypothetical protein
MQGHKLDGQKHSEHTLCPSDHWCMPQQAEWRQAVNLRLQYKHEEYQAIKSERACLPILEGFARQQACESWLLRARLTKFFTACP